MLSSISVLVQDLVRACQLVNEDPQKCSMIAEEPLSMRLYLSTTRVLQELKGKVRVTGIFPAKTNSGET